MTLAQARKLRKGDILILKPKGWNSAAEQKRWENAIGVFVRLIHHEDKIWIYCVGLQYFCPWGNENFTRPPREFTFMGHAEDWDAKAKV